MVRDHQKVFAWETLVKRFVLLILAAAAGWGMVGCGSSQPPTMALPPKKSETPPDFPPDKKIEEKRVPDPPEIR